ncbi:MAG: hypothetical protein WCD18_00685 [Thermosynechococcaceae cyanobacterium]
MSDRNFRLTDSEIQRLATLGGLAPSGGNVQPWKLRATAQTLELYLHPERSTSFIDIERYASIFSLGSVAENLAIASNYMGLQYAFQFLGYRDVSHPLARFEYWSRHDPPIAPAIDLYEAIEQRVTNRQPFDGTIIAPEALDTLQVAAQTHGGICQLWSLQDRASKKVAAQILGKADRIRMQHPALHQQLFGELRWTREAAESSQDGIHIQTLEFTPPALLGLALLSRYAIARLFPRKAVEALPLPALLSCSHFCCLSLNQPITPAALFTAGQVLQQVWLRATCLELALQPWTALPFFWIRALFFPGTGFSPSEELEIKTLGEDLRQLFGLSPASFPLFLFRLSKAAPPTGRSLRLDWETFTIKCET